MLEETAERGSGCPITILILYSRGKEKSASVGENEKGRIEIWDDIVLHEGFQVSLFLRERQDGEAVASGMIVKYGTDGTL